MPKNVAEGATELLVTTVKSLSSAGEEDYIVIGGWCPYIRNTSGITHPGTLDVDLLFEKGDKSQALGAAITALRRNGFIPSAKHPFQLLLEMRVADEQLIYNVDLLHPNMGEESMRLFVDQLDLDIPLDDDERRVKKIQSIVQPSSRVLFEENLYSEVNYAGIEFNLVDFTGMFITKMDSCQKQKRERDSFDIYIGFKSMQVDVKQLKNIASKHSRVAKSLRQLCAYLESEGERFNNNVLQFTSPRDASPAAYIREILCSEL